MSKNQAKTEDLHNHPLDAEIFQKTFNRYVQRFNTIFIVSVLLISAPFAAYLIAWYLEQTKVDITGFLNLWHTTGDLLMDIGFPYITYKVISVETISLGNLSLGVISAGMTFSLGVISIGGICSCGIISIGGMSSVGVIAIGYSRAYGVIAIATGKKNIHQRYPGGQAFGFIAIGRRARGVYSLSYDNEGEGTYQFSPKRQDPEAVELFTLWFKKFKGAFVLPSAVGDN